MNLLWERYIAVLLRRVAPPGVVIHTQERHAFWRPEHHRVREVRPDIVVRNAGAGAGDRALLVIDTKWKVPHNLLPSDEDLKQMFVYNELLEGTRSLLLYPATSAVAAGATGPERRSHACEQVRVGVFEGKGWSTPAIKQQLAALLAARLV
jgi:5-methylcytosine-specific restriction endonuclease McrBC regulatory subunit McrC